MHCRRPRDPFTNERIATPRQIALAARALFVVD
jgi:hypothetical protein